MGADGLLVSSPLGSQTVEVQADPVDLQVAHGLQLRRGPSPFLAALCGPWTASTPVWRTEAGFAV